MTARAGEVAGIVLAAGASSRMGRPKMLLPMGGGTLLSGVAGALLGGGLARVVVVLGCDADQVRRAAGLPEDRASRGARRLAFGHASSLLRGLTSARAAAALFALGDQAFYPAERVQLIVFPWSRARPWLSPSAAAAPDTRGSRRALCDELRAPLPRRRWRDVVQGPP